MKAAIGLYASYEVQNWVRKIVLDLHTRYGVPFRASLMPAHITLKQPFSFEGLERLERYFDRLAASIAPFEVTLDRVYHTRWGESGILGLNVAETGTLRALHNRINRELGELFEDPSAPHDGDTYHFHMTIELGEIEGEDPYQRYYDEMAEKRVDLRFMAQYLVLALAPGQDEPGSFMTYKVLPLTGEV